MDERTPESRHSGGVGKAFLWVLLPTLVLVLRAPFLGHAQVPTNITQTTGAGNLGTTVTHPAGTHLYNITNGTRPGGGPNLFHSFESFTVGPGDIANFANNTGLQTSNILGRVTGTTGNNPSLSSIYGTIQTTGFEGANLFLMNPAGFLFGPNATLNVGGSVSFTTAQYIRLFDSLGLSANFYANPANDGLANSILTINASAFEFLSPAAYGFLTAPDPSASITIQGSVLAVPSGRSMSLVGGKVIIESGTPEGGPAQPAQLLAPGGSIKLASAASPGEFEVNTLASLPNADFASFTSFGTVSLAPVSSIDVHGSSTVFIKGGQLVLSVSDATLSTSEGAALSDMILLTSGSTIRTSNLGAERGAEVGITVGTLNLADSAITTQTLNALGGDVAISADSVVLSSSSRISSGTDGIGNGGEISLRTQSLDVSQRSTIDSNTNASGRGGNIVVSVQEANLSGRGTITSLTNAFGSDAGEGGMITVQGLDGVGSKADSLTLAGSGSSIISNAFGTGRLGDIDVHVKTVSITNSAAILGGTQLASAEQAGNVTIDADLLSISDGGRIASQVFTANAGQIAIAADQLTMNNGMILTSTDGPGQGGNIVVDVGSVSLTNGASINSSASSTGQAGNVSIVAKTLNMDNASIATSTTSTGIAGNIKINSSGNVSLTNGSKISSASTGIDPTTNIDGTTEPPGRAGNITITATGGFTSDGSSVVTSAEANHGGDISITAGNVQLTNGTLINANSNGPLQVTKLVLDQNGQLVEQVVGDGNAGNITINSASSFIMQESSLTTAAAHASGGQITVNAPDIFQLTNSNIVTSVQGSSGDTHGGDISIDPQFVVLQNSQILAQANAGTGGNISIVSNVFLADPYSLVDATSQLGVSGVIDIRSPVSNISGVVGRLPESVLAAQALLRAACAARLAESKVSSFVERGRDHIPTGPEGLLATPYVPPPSEPTTPMSSAPISMIDTSGMQVRRLIGQDLTPRVHVLSGDAACQS